MSLLRTAGVPTPDLSTSAATAGFEAAQTNVVPQIPLESAVRSMRSLGVGRDGAAFGGEDASGRPCTVHRLRFDGAAEPHRQRKLTRRLAFHAQAKLEGVPGLLTVRAATQSQHPAVIIIEQTQRCLNDEPCLQGAAQGPEFERAVSLLGQLASTLALAHTEGIVHGRLNPKSVRVRDHSEGGGSAVSFLALRTMSDGQPDDLARALNPDLDDAEPRSVDDAFAFGGLVIFCVMGRDAAIALVSTHPRSATTTDLPAIKHPLMLLARELIDPEPSSRPTLHDCARRLESLANRPGTEGSMQTNMLTGSADVDATSVEGQPEADHEAEASHPERVGRFRLVAALGEGAMGKVFRGIDEDSGKSVAVKLLKNQGRPSPKTVKRFRKEARLLAELHNPGIALYLDAGEEGGVFYLVTELVEGQNLKSIIKDRGPCAERDAINLIVDLVRALVDVHNHGIVHRDLKPENMILVEGPAGAVGGAGSQVKLIDFGIARHFDESHSLAMTREGTVLGTPLYMAPEQVRGGVVDSRTDIYAVGTSLFELLIGRAPFAGRGIALVLALQLDQVPPRVAELRPEISDELSRIVARCLEKDPALRYQNALELLQALLPLVQTPAETVAEHPRPPVHATDSRQTWTFTWDLVAPPSALWPYISNTERLNKAIGLVAADEGVAIDGYEVTRLGRARQMGIALAWKENPFEWVFERRLGVLREYSEGPVRWYSSAVDLLPHEVNGSKGTRLVHHIELEPRGLLGRAAASVEVGVRTRRALDRTYRRIDELVQGRLGDAVFTDAFAETPPLPADKEARMAWLEGQTVALGADPSTVAHLGDWLRQAPAQDVARIRPIALAGKLGLDENSVVNACYQAASAGLLVPLWDLLCPTCRVPAAIKETLKALKDHAHCKACNIEFTLDLATSIELVFKVHSSLREADVRTYCISSPAHTPHVLAQVRLAPKTSFVIDCALPAGDYQLVGRHLGYCTAFRVRDDAPSSHWQVALATGPDPNDLRTFSGGRQEFVLVNDTPRDQVVRIERSTPRTDVVTAARALASPIFRRLFPGEILTTDAMVGVGAVTLLLAEVRARGGDSNVHDEEESVEKLYALYRALENKVIDCGGSIVKLQGEGVLAVFDEPAAAVRCAAAVPAVLQLLAPASSVRCAVHRGPAGAVSLNQHLDYFGQVVRQLLGLCQSAHFGELLVSDPVRADPAVDAALLKAELRAAADGSVSDLGHRFSFGNTPALNP